MRVGAPPVDGEANRAAAEELAAALDLPRGAVRIVLGARARVKVAEVHGLSVDAIRRRLESP